MKWFNLSVMDRYLIGELTLPFLFSVGLFTTLGVAIATLSDLLNKIIEYNLSWFLAMEIFWLKVPEFVTYALPISVLLTTLMTYSRLSKDSELIALYSCGISIYRLVTPALILSLSVTALTFLFNELIVPGANYQATTILVENLNENRQFLVRKDIFYPEYEATNQKNGNLSKELKTLFYAQKFDGESMRHLTVLITDKKGLNNIIVSEKAAWNPTEKVWDFFNGVIYKLGKDASYQDSTFFEQKQIVLPKAPLELAIQSRDPYEMNIIQANKYLKLLRLVGDEKTIWWCVGRTAQKIAFPFVCIVFCLVGSALGCRPSYSNKGTSFGLSVAVVFSYYLLSFIISSLGLVGILTPFLAAWLPNIFGLIVGSYLLYLGAKKP